MAEKYPDWLANTGNDPSYVDTEPFILHLQGPESGLTAEISNIQVSGVLHYNLTVNSFHYEAPGIADWSQFLLDILIGGNETIITGNYQLNGTLNGNSILGKGTWTATPNPGARYRLVMEYLFFQFENHNDQTYLGLKRSPLKQVECHFWGTRTYSMNGLDAAGSEEQIKNTILDSYFSQRRYNLRLPLQGQFLEYVENAFEVILYIKNTFWFHFLLRFL